jgi:hypothetical protein
MEKLGCLLWAESVIWHFRTADVRIGNPGIQRPLSASDRLGRLPVTQTKSSTVASTTESGQSLVGSASVGCESFSAARHRQLPGSSIFLAASRSNLEF